MSEGELVWDSSRETRGAIGTCSDGASDGAGGSRNRGGGGGVGKPRWSNGPSPLALSPGKEKIGFPLRSIFLLAAWVTFEGGNRPLGACLPGLRRGFPGRKPLFSLGNRLIFLACCLPAWPLRPPHAPHSPACLTLYSDTAARQDAKKSNALRNYPTADHPACIYLRSVLVWG